MSVIEWNKVKETEDCPKMLEVYLDQAWQDAFCYALAVEPPEKEWQQPKLLMTVISGNDSTLQAMKAAIALGGNGLHFGYGDKSLTGYEFNKDFQLCSEKGAYEKFPITINSNRKAIAIVHDKLLGNDEYVLSFEGDPAEDIRQVLGGGKYGLPILPEWKDIVYQELRNRGHLEDIEFYYDKGLFPNGFSLMKLNLEEEQADQLLSELIKTNLLKFPKEGTGKALENVKDLTTYMQSYVNDMVAKVSEQVTPTHNPIEDESFKDFENYKRQLFPVQAHVSTAIAKRLREQKSLILQGEMSTGKSTMLVALTDAYNQMKGKKGYHACLMVPPSLTKKWPEEIKEVIPDANVIVVDKTEQLIQYHADWTYAGRPKPTKPTFFVVSFTTMRGDCAIAPVVDFERIKTKKQIADDEPAFRYGYYCPDCGQAHQVIESTEVQLNENGEEVTTQSKRTMGPGEFGDTRRIHNSKNPANAFCSECGGSLWTKRVPTRYGSFKEWAKHEKKLSHALSQGNERLVKHVQDSQPEIPKIVGRPRRIATVEYIRRKMNKFFDLALVDEIHELKSGMSAQGNSLGSLAAASKKVVGATGTLFGGKAEDIYYLLWRLFPNEMVKNGYKYSEVRKWNEEYGNIEVTTVNFDDKGEFTNKQSRGGTKRTEKTLPGISPFVFGKFLIQNTVLVRLVDVWPDPVELVNVPTIFVDMDPELKQVYDDMEFTFKREIDVREDGHKLYLPLTNTGIAFPDNPFTYPDVLLKNEEGERELIWKPTHLPQTQLLNKEKKLQELISGEMAEGRKSIVYVRDTGSSVEGRDVRPRLKKILEDIGAKVEILDTSSTATNKRSEWVRKKIEKEDNDVIIVSQELVRVGLDLLCTPTLIFYQFSWSLFTISQASRRAWRISQSQECRLYYLSYKDCYQEQMAQLIAMKNRAASAINGETSSDGLAAMLGDDGDLQSMLIKSIKKGEKLKGSTEEWVAETSDRAREILAGIGKKKQPSLREQFNQWVRQQIETDSTLNVLLKKANSIVENIESGKINGFKSNQGVLEVDLIEAFGFDLVSDGAVLSHLVSVERKLANPTPYNASIFEVKAEEKKTKRSKKAPIDGQLAFSLFE
ncbi:DEAD/DEAH box helicase [Bacillus sp. AFS040349]|uniref:helicase-related protein n=1 Tax=Bacillus sp. AFS040349 TaxID=2033502 RepID=UPI000BFDDA62|nr:DEAD/DEAH box helicase [Bacillus sp. AFS040349]PGT83266.1 helicase [Bacillus sp. AFS040349]